MKTTLTLFTRYFCKRVSQQALSVLLSLSLIGIPLPAQAEELSEYTLKALFLYNFATFTAWPNRSMDNFHLCIYGKDPFGQGIDSLMKSKKINERMIDIDRISDVTQLRQCQLVFISSSALANLDDVVDAIKDDPILTVADSPGASRQGVILNMNVKDEKVTFEANLTMARKAGLNLSSQLLRLATEIHQ